MASYQVSIYRTVVSTCTIEAGSPEEALELGREVQSVWSLNDADYDEESGFTVYEPETDLSWHDTFEEEN
jgi:hypothetical protein